MGDHVEMYAQFTSTGQGRSQYNSRWAQAVGQTNSPLTIPTLFAYRKWLRRSAMYPPARTIVAMVQAAALLDLRAASGLSAGSGVTGATGSAAPSPAIPTCPVFPSAMSCATDKRRRA
jgi:hypothetical protein